MEIAKLTLLMMVLSPFCIWHLSKVLLFFPDKAEYDVAGPLETLKSKFKAEIAETSFPTEGGKKLHGIHFKLKESPRTFLVSHGNAGNLQHRLALIASLLATGNSVFLYDYQGYGKSEGEPTIPGICHDGQAAYDYLTGTAGLNANQIVLYGESLGCAVSCQVAKNRPVSGLVLQSGFASLIEAARDKLFWLHVFPDFSFPTPHLDNVAYVKEKHPPLLIIHGVHDYVLPYRYAERVFKNAQEPKTFLTLPDCGHNDIGVKNVDIYLHGLKAFMATLPVR